MENEKKVEDKPELSHKAWWICLDPKKSEKYSTRYETILRKKKKKQIETQTTFFPLDILSLNHHFNSFIDWSGTIQPLRSICTDRHTCVFFFSIFFFYLFFFVSQKLFHRGEIIFRFFCHVASLARFIHLWYSVSVLCQI